MASRLVRINSEERLNPTLRASNDFRVSLGSSTQLADINKIVIKHISIPSVQYNVKTGPTSHTTTNTFTFNNGADQTITLTPGYYTATQLAAAIVADALAVADGIAITLNATTKRFQFTSTNPVTYLSEASGNNMARLFGITADSAAGLSFDAQGLPDLQPHPNIYIASDALSDGNNMISPTIGSIPVIAIVPVFGDFGDIMQYDTNQDELDKKDYISFSHGKSLQMIDLRVYDGDGQLIDMQGLNWTIVFIAYSCPV
jgi:hypothetical protein